MTTAITEQLAYHIQQGELTVPDIMERCLLTSYDQLAIEAKKLDDATRVELINLWASTLHGAHSKACELLKIPITWFLKRVKDDTYQRSKRAVGLRLAGEAQEAAATAETSRDLRKAELRLQTVATLGSAYNPEDLTPKTKVESHKTIDIRAIMALTNANERLIQAKEIYGGNARHSDSGRHLEDTSKSRAKARPNISSDDSLQVGGAWNNTGESESAEEVANRFLQTADALLEGMLR